jgi:limonene 1,2-monooxygenase
MIRVEDWAPRDKIHRSYELLARYVMPQFQGSLTGIITSNQWASERKEALQANRMAGLKRATDSFFTTRS